MQAIIDHVARFLLAQGRRSENHAGCLYSGPGGMACGVGCLLKPGAGERLDKRAQGGTAVHAIGLDDYRDEFVSDDVRDAEFIDRAHYERGGNARDRFICLLSEIQTVHDTIDPEMWGAKLDALAQTWGLDAPGATQA